MKEEKERVEKEKEKEKAEEIRDVSAAMEVCSHKSILTVCASEHVNCVHTANNSHDVCMPLRYLHVPCRTLFL